MHKNKSIYKYIDKLTIVFKYNCILKNTPTVTTNFILPELKNLLHVRTQKFLRKKF